MGKQISHVQYVGQAWGPVRLNIVIIRVNKNVD